MDEQAHGSNRLSTFTSVALSHIALLATLAVFLFTALKLLAVAHGNRTTFVVLAGSLNPSQVLLVVVPFVLPVVMMFGVVLAVLQASYSGLPALSYDSFLLAGSVAVMAIMPIYAIALAAGMLAVIFLNRRINGWREAKGRKRQESRRDAGSFLIGVSGIAFLMFLFYVLSDQNLWLPPEAIRLSNSQDLTAYVVSATDDSLVVMRESDRVIVRITADEVTSRSFCEIDQQPWYDQSLLQRARPSPDYPQCP